MAHAHGKHNLAELQHYTPRILFAVIPDFLAREIYNHVSKVRGEFQEQQFNNLYIQRHQDVSILYADIKGFTGKSTNFYTFYSVAVSSNIDKSNKPNLLNYVPV